MKKIFTLSIMLTVLAIQANATVWRINNNLGVDADFTQISSALASSSVLAGDTLYIEGSATPYNGFTIDKKITIIGTGYFLTDSANTNTQWNTQSAKVGTVTFAVGSKGSVISGVQGSGIIINDSLITIERCYMNNYIYFAYASNSYADHDTLRQCVVYGIQSLTSSGFARGLMIYNNILYGSSNVSNLTNTNAYCINNILINSFNCQNFVYENNIFLNASFGAYGGSNYFANNIFPNSSANAGVAATNSNQFSVSINTLFAPGAINFDNPPTGYSHDGQYQLSSSSAALNAGNINGTTVDCGIFGGPAPYILSGMPNIPSIYSLTVPVQVNNGISSINISLSAAAH